tara:strand:- start:936 stop:1562 length:627 start_codon:yes stop_codon:yes gene_type:complete
MTKGINEAFVAAQKLIGGARKSSSNPHFKSKYADLKECFNACSDILNDHGISISQPTVMLNEEIFAIRTILTHTSGEAKQDFGVPILGWKNQSNEAQKFGAGQTYARRFGLCGMVGIAPEDDDGNSLTQDTPKKNPAGISRLRGELSAFTKDLYACTDIDMYEGLKSSHTDFLTRIQEYDTGWFGDGGDIKGLRKEMSEIFLQLSESN